MADDKPWQAAPPAADFDTTQHVLPDGRLVVLTPKYANNENGWTVGTFLGVGWSLERLIEYGFACAVDVVLHPAVHAVDDVLNMPQVELAVRGDRRWNGSLPRVARAVQELLDAIDPDPMRAGLAETPMRVAKAWQHYTSGYDIDPADVLKVFDDGAQQCDEMVVRKHIPIHSTCEHHLAPIFGEAIIAYIPNGKIVGLSKLDRLADIFARRLQVQERMTNQIAEALQTHLVPAGCGVVIKARHMCIESRGVGHANSQTVTSALRGCFKDDARVRAEFLSLAHNGD